MKDTMFEFEAEVDDVRTSRVKNDKCPISGKFNYQGTDVKFTMMFEADAQDVFDDMFGGVGKTVTFAVVDNAQQTL